MEIFGKVIHSQLIICTEKYPTVIIFGVRNFIVSKFMQKNYHTILGIPKYFSTENFPNYSIIEIIIHVLKFCNFPWHTKFFMLEKLPNMQQYILSQPTGGETY